MHKPCYNDIALNKKDSSIVKYFFLKRKMTDMWKHIDSLKICEYKNNELEVVFERDKAVVRVWTI